MASLFRSPRPLPPARFFPPTPLPAAVQTTNSATAKAAAKATAIENKRRRGRGGTIATSFRGVLLPQDALPRRKRLLGE